MTPPSRAGGVSERPSRGAAGTSGLASPSGAASLLDAALHPLAAHAHAVGNADEAPAEAGEADASLPTRRAASKHRPRRAAGDPGCCQVAGCGTSLDGAPAYHRRYRICDPHFRASCTVLDGVQSRFCQQCGRFHDISAFDANCRSCRKELELHNKRRRKRAAALAAAGLQPSRGRKGSAAAALTAPGGRAAAASDQALLRAHAANAAAAAAAAAGGPSPYGMHGQASVNMLEQVLGWSALRGGGVQMPGHGGVVGHGHHSSADLQNMHSAAAAAAAANAGVAAALAAFAARHVGTGASIYGGGGLPAAAPGGGALGPAGMHAAPPLPGGMGGMHGRMGGGASALFGDALADGGAAALLSTGWPHPDPGAPPAGAGLLSDTLMGFPYA